MNLTRIAAPLLALSLSAVVAFAQPPSYRVTHLGRNLTAVAMNDAGQVTGTFLSPKGLQLIFLWKNGTLKNLGALGFNGGTPTAINASGQVTGYVCDSCNVPIPPFSRNIFFWDGNTARNLGQGYGDAINKAGKIAANATVDIPNVGTDTHAHFWNGNSLRDLGTLGGTLSIAHDVNDAGHVTGASHDASGATHAFLWNGSTMRDLGTLGGIGSVGAAINALGQVTGRSSTASGASHAFLWDGTTMRDLGPTSPNLSCYALDINDFGQVAGECETLESDIIGFAWDGSALLGLGFGAVRASVRSINNSGFVTGTGAESGFYGYLWDGIATYKLDDLIDSDDPLASRVRIRGAKVINNRGQILAEGRLDGALRHTFLLTPAVTHDLKGLTLSTSAVGGCRNVIGTVTLTRTAPAGGVRVALKDTMSAASMPTSVTIPQGAISKNFTIRTTQVATTQRGIIGAIMNGNSFTKTLRISPADC